MWSEVIAAWWIWLVPIAFVAVLVYVFNPKRKKAFEVEARVPIEDNKPDKTAK
jgi:cbb3-type cytochrome oxidase subunit 3